GRYRVQRPRRKHERILCGLCFEVVGSLMERKSSGLADLLDCPLRKLRMSVDSGTGGGSAKRELRQIVRGETQAFNSLANLGRVAAELLAESNRRCVHQVGPPALEDVVELFRLCFERRGELLQGGDELLLDADTRGDMHRRRND